MVLLLMVVQALLALLVGLVLYGFHPLQRWRYRHIPGPRPTWLVGNILEILREGQETACARWGRQYGPVWCFWMGGIPVVMTDDPQLARKVLVRPARHKIFNLHVGEQERFESNNIVFTNGEKWKLTRNAWQPFFSHGSIARSSGLMAESAGRLCRQLGSAADEGREVDIWRELGKMTMDVVGTTAFGVDFNTLEREHEGAQAPQGSVQTPADRLIWAVSTFFDCFGLANVYFGLFFLFGECEHLIKWLANLAPNAAFKQDLASRKALREVGTELIQQSQQHSLTAASAAAAATSRAQAGSGASQRPSTVDPGSFLALILPAVGKRAELDDLWATNQATSFILAGYETTANTLAFCIYLLATHPEAEARLVAEVDAFGRERSPTADSVDSAFPYVNAVIQEGLRLYPPATTAVREGKEGMTLGAYDIPAGTALQVSIYSMHRNERYWRDPLAFKPERFLPGTPEAAEVVPGAHLPFGDGARKCIGFRFALMEATLTLVKLYQQYTFRLLPGQQPLKVRTLLTMGPEGAVRVTVHRRS